jgi:hypothetical protein
LKKWNTLKNPVNFFIFIKKFENFEKIKYIQHNESIENKKRRLRPLAVVAGTLGV